MRLRLAFVLLTLAAAFYWWPRSPQPVPAPQGEIDLDGAFQGEGAAEDAASLAAMADEIASTIEWDADQAQPTLTTGRSLDTLRTRTREFMMRGESLGERHPRMRQIVGDYLENKLGTSGGEVTPEQRAQWIAAYREIARSARHAIAQ